MNIGDAVRVVAATPEFYNTVSFSGPDPLMLGRQGRIVDFVMNDQFEPGWRVELTNGGTKFFYEAELEAIEKIDGPPVEKAERIPPPSWYDDLAELKSKLFNVQVLGKEFHEEFSDKDGNVWYEDENHVEDKIQRLTRGEE